MSGTNATCVYREQSGSVTQRTWEAEPRAVPTWQLGNDGTLNGTSIPTPECEALPVLSVVDGHAVVTAWVATPTIPPAPNDTSQYDIGLSVLDLSSSSVVHEIISMNEDDIVEALAPCGNGEVCLAGTTGTRSVDTGSRVTDGDGFVLPVSLSDTRGTRWTLHSERNSEVELLAPRADGSVLFFASSDGPITHTDPTLRYNRGLLGVVAPSL